MSIEEQTFLDARPPILNCMMSVWEFVKNVEDRLLTRAAPFPSRPL